MAPHRSLLHIGFPKAGSTTLQTGLFQAHPDLVSLAKPFPADDDRAHAIHQAVRFCDSAAIGPRLAGLRAELATLVDPDDRRTPVWSAEDYAVGPYWPSRQHKTADRVSIATTLAQLLPGAVVLVVVREPVSWLQSCYAQLRTGGAPLPRFRPWVDEQLDTRGAGSMLDALDLEPLVSTYDRLFGRDEVLVTAFDDLVARPEAVARRITGVLGLPPAPPGATAAGAANARRSAARTAARRLERRHPAVRRLAHRVPPPVRAAARRLADTGAGGRVDVEPTPAQRRAIGEATRPAWEWLAARRAEDGVG